MKEQKKVKKVMKHLKEDVKGCKESMKEDKMLAKSIKKK